jgi:alkanesulfonate monooxygenase SsuD/methylene tetrahydromethanopterin reductase-like flavin-dependent oxidoreductase (luciferase family)
MTEDQDRGKSDMIAKARTQLAAVTKEFQHGLTTVKDPVQRRKLADNYLDVVQKYLAKAQDSLAHYRSKNQTTEPADPDQAPPAG